MLKRKVKRVLEYAAAASGWHRRNPGDPTLLILGYHRILPEVHPEYHLMQPGMRVRPETLEMHIKVLKKYFDFVDINDWIQKAKNREEIPRKAVALTFDDGWVDNYQYAFPILKKQNVPATIFLVSSMIGTKKHFWPERVSSVIDYFRKKGKSVIQSPHIQWFKQYGFDLHDEDAFSEENVDRLIMTLKNYSEKSIYESLNSFSEVESSIDYPVQILNKSQLHEMVDSGLVSYGAHTRHHYRLNKVVDHETLEDEISGCKDELEELLGISIQGFCYPNGNYHDKSLALVRKNYLSACSVESGRNTVHSDFHLLKRVMLHEDISSNRISFEAKVSGFL